MPSASSLILQEGGVVTAMIRRVLLNSIAK
jgi:hypothetical protein